MNKKADNNFHTMSHCSCIRLVGMLKLVALLKITDNKKM